MKKGSWIICFIGVLAFHLTGILLNSKTLEYLSKPLIVALLILYFFSQTKRINSGLKKWIMASLFFSWAGDVLLMFQHTGSVFFLLGLSAFLIAHICYILFFNNVRANENVPRKILLLVIVVIYYATLIALLSPYLGDMRLPVRIYGIVISIMFMLAMHMLFIKNRTAGKWMMAGAFLFVLSDSTLAVNKFYHSFEEAGIAIMVTYGFAQLFIVEGAIKYITSVVTLKHSLK